MSVYVCVHILELDKVVLKFTWKKKYLRGAKTVSFFKKKKKKEWSITYFTQTVKLTKINIIRIIQIVRLSLKLIIRTIQFGTQINK